MSLDNGQIVGSYRVVKQLGKGGVGSVYLAIHQHIHRQVALKVLNAEYANNPDVVSRFLHEARVVNLVKHPGLVQVSDFGQLPDGTVYIVMEYLEGKTLLDLLREHGRLDELRALDIANQIASTLAAAHAKRIIHREVLLIDSDCLRSSGKPPQRRRQDYDHSQRRQETHIPLSKRRRYDAYHGEA